MNSNIGEITVRRSENGRSFTLRSGAMRLQAALSAIGRAEVLVYETGEVLEVSEVNGELVAVSKETAGIGKPPDMTGNAIYIDSQTAIARRTGQPAKFEFNGHVIQYADKVTCDMCSVPEVISSAVTFAWRHKVRTMTVDGATITRIN